MDSPKTILIVFTIFLSLFISCPLKIKAQAPSKLVENACKQTANYKFCVDVLQSDKRASSAKSVLELTKAALDLAIINSSNSKDYIVGMLKSKPALKAPLESCVTSYTGSVNSFKSSLASVEEDPMTANYDAKVAGDGADECDRAFADAKVRDESIATRNQEVKNFSGITFVLTDMLD